jgi:sugar lactone lactonase YvrE
VGEEEARPIVKPYGFAIWEDRIYVCDTVLAGLVVIDLGDRRLRYVFPDGPGRLIKPINLAIDVDGTKYVADAQRGLVVILDREDRYAGELARREGTRPTDVAISGDRVYVTDLEHRRIDVWEKAARRYLNSIPAADAQSSAAVSGAQGLYSPVNLAVDQDGNLYVSDLGAFRVQKYDPGGHYLSSFGSLGNGPGQFVRPKGIDIDSEGRLFVVDAATEVVQIFDREGDLLLFFGQPAGRQEHGFALSLPATVQVNSSLLPYFQRFAAPGFWLESLILVSSQYGDHKISVFGFGSEAGSR